jgi:hypothetical protein
VGRDVSGWYGPLLLRLFRQAEATGSRWLHEWHIVMALLDPPEPTVASAALAHVALDRDQLRAWCDAAAADAPDGADGVAGMSSTPAQQIVVARAHGLAVASGTPVTDEHLLLALMYDGGDGFLTSLDVDRDALYAYLADHGVAVPPIRPPAASSRPPMTRRVYVRSRHADAVVRELARRYPPGAERWDTNEDRARPDWVWFVASDGIDLEAVVRSVVPDLHWGTGPR